jgi:hypothetical protein
MSLDRIETISGCLHVQVCEAQDAMKGSPSYDKLHKIQWLMDKTSDKEKELWNLRKRNTVNEMMLHYKEPFCCICQYLPSKPEKWGIKFWCGADLKSKFAWTCNAYCGANTIIDACPN